MLRRRWRKIMIYFGLFVLCLAIGVWIFLAQEKFGAVAAGERLARMQASANYRNGVFVNTVPTSSRTEGVSFPGMMWEFWFSKKERLAPKTALPSVKTALSELDKNRDAVVWFGHSSFLLQLGGKRILADPVFSPYASPFSFSTRAFPGTTVYGPHDMPDIDYLVVSHDHWDHLDYPTVTALRDNVGKVICGLGVGAHFERWGFDKSKIIEADWNATLEPEPGFTVHLRTARHFSGRTLRFDRTQWTSFIFEANGRRIFYSGDTGYGPHMAAIGEEFQGMDLAILENGQYDKNWKYIHMAPEQTAKAAIDLKARALLPVHCGKFSIAAHSWDDPFIRVSAASEGKPYRLLTPMIGEPVWLDAAGQTFAKWWEGID